MLFERKLGLGRAVSGVHALALEGEESFGLHFQWRLNVFFCKQLKFLAELKGVVNVRV